MSATTSAWSEEKPKHVRDVALALRARVREGNCASLEECEWFRDMEKFTTLSADILSTHHRVPARSFQHTERFRNTVRRAYYRELEAQDDIAHTATSPPPRSPSLTSPRPRRRVQRRKSTSRRVGDWVTPLKVLGMAILLGAFGFMVFFGGVLVCDLCQENFERLAGTRTENATSGNDAAPQ